jgi:3-methyladenine DNA glycosylase AlkD
MTPSEIHRLREDLAVPVRDKDEDLIQKTVGGMLREIGKRDAAAANAFWRVPYRRMPRAIRR